MKLIAANKNKNKAKFKFQVQYTRSQRWFDLEFDCIEVNFITREPDLYKKISHNHDNTQDTDTYKRFQVPIGNAKYLESFKFQTDAPILNYCQKSLNGSCFISLASAFSSINHNKAADYISFCIE